jgi:hypothetical protein
MMISVIGTNLAVLACVEASVPYNWSSANNKANS